ncbi:MAG: hypothetical protein JW384_01165 [Nitrosomonadaceae bacterium]|jgi:hypothetical protein|nr:hypothetical protein [Nitrosomonadaceae bacterium]
MSHPFYHAKSSAKKFGGHFEDYIALHEWFDQTKAHLPDARHRAVLHSSFGIYMAQQVFGEVIVRKSDGKPVPTRMLGEQHILEDMGMIPTLQDWLKELPLRSWMIRGAKALSKEVESDPVPCESPAEVVSQ